MRMKIVNSHFSKELVTVYGQTTGSVVQLS